AQARRRRRAWGSTSRTRGICPTLPVSEPWSPLVPEASWAAIHVGGLAGLGAEALGFSHRPSLLANRTQYPRFRKKRQDDAGFSGPSVRRTKPTDAVRSLGRLWVSL